MRITTRWDQAYFPAGLYGAMHECGHGLYEDGIPESMRRSPLGSGQSLGLHESQSRMWENMVGRGRPFCGVLMPRIAALFGGALQDIDADSLYRAVNQIEPRLAEAAKMGFQRVVLPRSSARRLEAPRVQLLPVDLVGEALELLE